MLCFYHLSDTAWFIAICFVFVNKKSHIGGVKAKKSMKMSNNLSIREGRSLLSIFLFCYIFYLVFTLIAG